MGIRGILFDKDGTLLDFHATWMPLYRRGALAAAGGDAGLAETLMAAGGYEPARARVRAGSTLAAGNTAEIAELWADLLPGGDAAALTAQLDRLFLAGIHETAAALADLPSLLPALKARGQVLGLATSDSAAGARASLEALAVAALFDFVAGYDSGHGVKPGPGMAEAFCAATGLTGAQIAVVGDNRHDLEMGRAAGAGLLVGVLSGTAARGDLADLADHVIDDVTQLPGLVDGFGSS